MGQRPSGYIVSLPIVGDHELQSLIAQGGQLLVDFRADWCSQCGPQENVLERVAPSYDAVSFVAVDVGADPNVAERYNVMTLPALLLFSGGELNSRLVGFSKAPTVRDALDQLATDG